MACRPGRLPLLVPLLAPIALTLACGGGSGDPGAKCGEERWAVKTLSDGDAGRVNLTPVPISVAELRALPTPQSRPNNSRVAPVELKTYSLMARVVEFKIEDDKDVHLVIADPANASATMIVEFPDAAVCQGADRSSDADLMRQARADLVAAFGQPSAGSFHSLQGLANITGVGFFDFLHGQTGVAPNGIELHPVLHIEPVTQSPP